MLVILAIAAAIAYYAYQGITGAGEAPTCKGAFSECMQTCRRTTTEAAESQACQRACQRDADACGRGR